MEKLHVHVTRRMCSTGPIAVVRLTSGQAVDWCTVRLPDASLPNKTLGAVVKAALKHHADGDAVCAEYWLRLEG